MSRRPLDLPRNLASWIVSILALCAITGTAMAERAPHRHKHPAPQAQRHDTKFAPVPESKLQIRAVEYDGSTNGTLKVQIKNPEPTAQTFVATGLYFVPQGDPDAAPQRLGAVGPMQLTAEARQELTKLEVAPGATVEVALDVFCIDSHRSSPTPRNAFTVGKSRLPKELARTIEHRADAAVSEERAKGVAAPRPAAKGKIQSEVWRSRDAKWIKLDGEGKQEVAK
jgi:hypothetical protein